MLWLAVNSGKHFSDPIPEFILYHGIMQCLYNINIVYGVIFLLVHGHGVQNITLRHETLDIFGSGGQGLRFRKNFMNIGNGQLFSYVGGCCGIQVGCFVPVWTLSFPVALLVANATCGSGDPGKKLFPLTLPLSTTLELATCFATLVTKLHWPKAAAAALFQQFGSCLQVGDHSIMHIRNILQELF